MRRDHPRWGPRRLLFELARAGFDPVPSRSTVYRVLVRHQLVAAIARKRRREDYRRWERQVSMQLWQLDVMGSVFLVDGTECKLISGVDDHSRFAVIGKVVTRASSTRPTPPSNGHRPRTRYPSTEAEPSPIIWS